MSIAFCFYILGVHRGNYEVTTMTVAR